MEAQVTGTTPLMSNSDRHSVDGDIADLPKARQVEYVHIEKKKCGCCNLQ